MPKYIPIEYYPNPLNVLQICSGHSIGPGCFCLRMDIIWTNPRLKRDRIVSGLSLTAAAGVIQRRNFIEVRLGKKRNCDDNYKAREALEPIKGTAPEEKSTAAGAPGFARGSTSAAKARSLTGKKSIIVAVPVQGSGPKTSSIDPEKRPGP